jgi:predicted dehydrogenase
VKIAVVGLGKMGIVHSCVLNVLPGVQPVALCEKSSLTRRLLRKVFRGVTIVDDVGKLEGLGLDAVFVTTPIPSHFTIAKALLEGEVASNLFVEKTLAASYPEAKEMCDLIARSAGVGMVGYLRRFYVTFRKAKDLLSQGAVGDVSSFTAYANSSDFLGVKRDAFLATARGGVLMDLGCHAVDLALWFFGDLKVQSAKIESIVCQDSEDSVSFSILGDSGLEGLVKSSWCAENYRMAEAGFSIKGSKGIMEVSDDKVTLREKNGKLSVWYRHDLSDAVPFWLGLPEFYREDLAFVEAVKTGQCVEPSFGAAAKADRIIDEVKKKAGGTY